MPATLRVGLIGLGSIGRHHARVLRELPGVTLTAAADPRGDPYRAAPGIPVVPSLEELLNHRLDYCVVATPTTDHEPTALALADAGVHALIEKPLADNAEAAHRVADAFDDARLRGAVGHIERYNPALRELRTRLQHGQLGDLYQVATRRQGPYPTRVRDVGVGVGVVKDLATHDLDLTTWLTGQPFSWVAAHTTSRTGGPYEDLLAAIGTLATGVITSHLVNWLSPLKERITVVTGEHGCLTADTLTTDLTHHTNATSRTEQQQLGLTSRGFVQGDVTGYTVARQEPLLAEHQAFRDAVLGLPSDIVTMREGAAAVAAADAILIAAMTGTGINLCVPRPPPCPGSTYPLVTS